jgi:predicted Zn-dependent peptidase
MEDFKPSEDEVALLRWRQAISWNGSYATNAGLAKELAWMRLADSPVDLLQNYPDFLTAVTAQDLTRLAAECRKTATLLGAAGPLSG